MRWEAVYTNGAVIRDGEGPQYRDLNRNGLAKLRVRDGDKLIGEAEAADGRVLFWRLRTFNLGRWNESKICLLGWKSRDAVCFTLFHSNGEHESFKEWNTTPLTAEPEWFSDERL